MKKSSPIVSIVLLGIITLTLCVVHHIIIKNNSHENKEVALLQAAQIQNDIVSQFSNCTLVAKTMAHDTFLIKALKTEHLKSQEQATKEIQEYLEKIRKMTSYTSVCAISDATHRYYRNDGIHKIIDPEKDPHDIWFQSFKESYSPFDIRIYRSLDKKNTTRFFVNARIEDEDGTFLGVVSTAMYVSNLQTYLNSIETRYNIKVNLADTTGLVMLDSNPEDVEVASLAHIVLKKGHLDTGYHYRPYGSTGYIITKYIDSLHWFFVARKTDTRNSVILHYLFYIVACIFFIFGSFAIILLTKHRTILTDTSSNNGQIDILTGLPNRNFFKEVYGEKGVFNTTRYRCLAVVDIDYFKAHNDYIDGNKTLVSVVNIIMYHLKERGIALRWGGDEFVLLCELPIEQTYPICRQICHDVEERTEVTVSIGLVKVRISDTIKKNYYRAIQCCYQAKEMGGNGVKKGQ